MVDDLWPDDIGLPTKLKAPVTILREQASLLGKKTQNLVEAKVRRLMIESTTRDFWYGFYIVAPALGHYSYQLFIIRYSIKLYPVVLSSFDTDIRKEISPSKVELSAESESEFLEISGKILRTKKTRQVIEALLAQVGSAEELPL